MCNRKGRWLRSTLVRCAMRYSAPKRSACLRMFSTSCGPMIPSGKPGKFSTNVVIESCPPGSWPSMTSGFRLARAVYKAAVCPEHPEPMMTTLRVSLMDYQVNKLDGRLAILIRTTRDARSLGRRHRFSHLRSARRRSFRRRMRFWHAIDFRQFLGYDGLHAKQFAIVCQDVRGAAE